MKFKLLLITASLLFLFACSTIHKKYDQFRNKHETYHPTPKSVPAPKGVNQKHTHNNYRVKPLNNADQIEQVPLTPPDSRLNHSNYSIPATKPVLLIPNVKVQGSLVKKSFDKVWKQVGQAIQISGYRILDQDNGLGTYYLLDTQSTQGKIQQDTPIYQLHLKKVNKGVELTLLNSKNQLAKAAVAERILGEIIRTTKKMH